MGQSTGYVLVGVHQGVDVVMPAADLVLLGSLVVHGSDLGTVATPRVELFPAEGIHEDSMFLHALLRLLGVLGAEAQHGAHLAVTAVRLVRVVG